MDVSETKPKKILTLILICDDDKQTILLGMKKRGFGEGWWNGFGGKKHSNETIEECAVRETHEECGLKMEEYFQIANMTFEFIGDPVLLDVHVFRCDKYSGTLQETEEMRPQWFSYDKIPFDKMWPDDYLWYPHLLKKQKFKAYFLFEGHHKMLKQNIELL